MPKADRILANLPPTFALRGDPSALRALVDAYGGELQLAENALVAVMRAHWAELADAGERVLTDLGRPPGGAGHGGIAALYGLAPRADESVEEFRTRLLRHVRTALEGTVTVQGILRVTAQTLGLAIDDALDPWWDRADPLLLTTEPRGQDAAALVLGRPQVAVVGRDAAPAVLRGRTDLSAGVDLTGAHLLWLALDGGGETRVDLRAGAADPAAVTPAELVAAIDDAVGPGVAHVEDGRLVLVSPTLEDASAVLAGDGPDDAAELVLGLRPRTYAGSERTRARITGTVDLSAALDLRGARYLRLAVDGALAEVDCAAAAPDPSAVDLAQVTAAINDALGLAVASDDGRLLSLASPTDGPAGSVVLLEPAAQPATRRLLGDVAPSAVGRAAAPARVVGDRALGRGVDLTTGSRLRLVLDAQPAVTVDVAGSDPAATLPAEIVTAVNEAVGAQSASHDGDRITLVSPTPGAAGQVAVEEVEGDAARSVLGLDPRGAVRNPRADARVVGEVDLTEGVDLSSRHVLVLAVDGRPPVEVDLRAGVGDRTAVVLDELVAAVNGALGAEVAGHDGAHLVLVSTLEGSAGAIEVRPARATLRRRFVTRARVTDDAGTTVLGYVERHATGSPGTAARLAGTVDLSRGADLSTHRYLRLTVGDRAPVEVDCAGLRPRVTTPAEVVAAVNGALGLPPDLAPVAATDGTTVVLTDPLPGAGSRLLLEAPRTLDALDALGIAPAAVRGSPATGVRLVGTVDLSAGALLPADAALRIGVDGAAPVDVPVGDGVLDAVRSLSRVVAQIGLVVGGVAAHDGTHLLLTSPTTGAGSGLVLEPPTAGTDVTATLLGFAAPRSYAGTPATAAEVVGTVDLTGGVDLTVAHLLRVSVDGGPGIEVDLTTDVAADARGSVGVAEIAAAIRAATTADARSVPVPGGVGLAIASPSAGLASRLTVERTTAGDATGVLLGDAPRSAVGAAAAPATLAGDVSLLGPVDLSGRSLLRLQVDGGEPVDVDVAGVEPGVTLGGEVVAAIDGVLPGVATLSPDQRLLLTSPTTGPDGRVAVLPVRHLDLAEYPPVAASAEGDVTHGSVLVLASNGSADVPGLVTVTTRGGVASPRVGDPVAGWSVQVTAALPAGGTLVLEPQPAGRVRALLTGPAGTSEIDPDLVEVVPAPGTGRFPALTVRRGRQRWSWTECTADRFDGARFDSARFAGGACTEVAVFDVSRFSPTQVPAAFGDGADRAATAHLAVGWDAHTAGAFEVRLPADLDPRFGRRFDEARFGTAEPQLVAGVMTEPADNPDHLLTRVNAATPQIVVVDTATVVPIGWEPVTLPFRDPRPLTLGRSDRAARLYLTGPGLDPPFLVVRARHPGEYGNTVTVAARLVGPEVYDLTIALPGATFESARAVVLGPPPPSLATALVAAGPGGVAGAKAAGVAAAVTRERAIPPPPLPSG